MLHKTIEKGIAVEDTATLYFLIMQIMSDKPLITWKDQMSESNFMKILGILFICMERLNQTGSSKDIPIIYHLLAGKSMGEKPLHPIITQENSSKFYLWLWQAKFNEIDEVTDILK